MAEIILPGENEKNREWLGEFFRDSGATPFYYSHWGKSKDIDFNKELSILEVISNDYDFSKVYAKSAGTMLALYAMGKGIFKPDECIFMGVPLLWIVKKGLKNDFIKLSSKFDFIKYYQNSNDPFGTPDELGRILGKEIISIDAFGHEYPYSSIIENRL